MEPRRPTGRRSRRRHITEGQILTFRELIAPVEPEDFFRNYYGKKALHIPGPPEKFAEVFSWKELNELLGMSTLWTDRSFELALNGRLLGPEEYCYPSATRENRPAMKPDVERVRKLLREGATMVLDFIELLSPGLRSVAQTLEAVTGAQVCASTFCSWKETQGYGSHFDAQNVFACHLAGSKTWHIYEGRMLNATNFPGSKMEGFSKDHHKRAKGKILAEIKMSPGDLLYIPHGQYHDALSSSEACLHVSFGSMHLVAQDFILAVVKDLTKDPMFREHLPHIDDLELHEPYLNRIAGRLYEIISQPAIAQQLRDFMRGKAFERVSDFNLPLRDDGARYRVRWRRKRLCRDGTAWRLDGEGTTLGLDDAEAETAQWALQRDLFSAETFRQAFEGRDAKMLAMLLDRMQRIGLVERF